MNSIKQIKLIRNKIFVLIILFMCNINYALCNNLIETKYANFINDWGYYNEYENGLTDSGGLVINNCKDDLCDFSIDTVSTKLSLCTLEGQIKITSLNSAIAISKNEKTNEICETEVSVSKDGGILSLKFSKIEGKCDIIDSASCGFHGHILYNFESSIYSDKVVYNPSFKCENLNLISDILVCTNENLAYSDKKLNDLYKKILKKYKNNKDLLGIIKNRQKEWNETKSKITYFNDLVKLYDEKIRYLDCLNEIEKYDYCNKTWK